MRHRIGRPITDPLGSYMAGPGRSRYRATTARMVHYLGGICASCGMSNLEHEELHGTDLELDHIDPATKVYNPKAHWAYAWDSIVGELAKCQPLCQECHQAKTKAAV